MRHGGLENINKKKHFYSVNLSVKASNVLIKKKKKNHLLNPRSLTKKSSSPLMPTILNVGLITKGSSLIIKLTKIQCLHFE